MDLSVLLESIDFNEFSDNMPFRLFVINEERKLIFQNCPEKDDLDTPLNPGIIHSSNCDTCEFCQYDCPVDQCFRTGVRLNQVLAGGDDHKQQFEVDLIPHTVSSRVKYVIVIQRELSSHIDKLVKIESDLQRRIRQQDIMNQVLAAMQASQDLDRIVHVILCALTFGQGLEFNRAFFLTRENDELVGAMAVGPIDGAEAASIWQTDELKRLSLEELLQSLDEEGMDTAINKLVKSIRFNLAIAPQVMRDALVQGGIYELHRADSREPGTIKVLEILQTDKCWFTPIFKRSSAGSTQWNGLLIVDNAITNRLPTSDHLDALVSCAHHLGFALERSGMNRKLKSQVKELELTNTALARSREELIVAEKLATVGRITANLAHELKTPIMSIGGFARLLRKSLLNQPELAEKSEIILNESKRVEKILDALMDYSEPQILRRSDVDVLAILNKELDKEAGSFDEFGIRYQIHSPEEELLLWGDPIRLAQMFHCLIKNVLDINVLNFNGARICETLDIEISFDDTELIIEFADDGPGVSEDITKQIFDPFFSSHTSSLGLGLTLSRDIANQHGGSLTFTGEGLEGHGSRFKLALSWRYYGEDSIR
jgi:signal transduction histidine kinase